MLGHSTTMVRDFSAKSFSIVLKKISSGKFKSHLLKVFKVLSSHLSNENECTFKIYPVDILTKQESLENLPRRLRNIISGFSLYIFYGVKGVKGCLHSKAASKLRSLFSTMVSQDLLSTINETEHHKSITKLHIIGNILSLATAKIIFHIFPSNSIDLWKQLIEILNQCSSLSLLLETNSATSQQWQLLMISANYITEIVIYALTNSSYRLLRDEAVKRSISKALVNSVLGFCESFILKHYNFVQHDININRIQELFCHTWVFYPSSSEIRVRSSSLISNIARFMNPKDIPGSMVLSSILFPSLPPSILKNYCLLPMLNSIVDLLQGDLFSSDLLNVLLEVFIQIDDTRLTTKRRINVDQIVPQDQDVDEDVDEWEYDENMIDDDDSSEEVETSEIIKVKPQVAKETTSFFLLSCEKQLKQVIEICMKSLDETVTTSNKSRFQEAKLSLNCVLWIVKSYKTSHSWKVFNSFVSNIVTNLKSKSSLNLLEEKDFLELSILEMASILNEDNLTVLKDILKLLMNTFLEYPRSIALTSTILRIIDILQSNIQETFSWELVLDSSQIDYYLTTISETLLFPSYWLRMNLIHVFSYFPHPELIHGTTDSNTEEKEFIDVGRICLEAVCLPVGIASEREFSRRISNLEVLVSNGRLSISYARVIVAFCLNVFFVKFSPFWDPALLLLSGVAEYELRSQQDILWPLLIKSIQYIGAKDTIDSDKSKESALCLEEKVQSLFKHDNGEEKFPVDITSSKFFYYKADLRAFAKSVVEVDARTDSQTVYNSLLSILKRNPGITVKKSKVIIPIFLSFLSNQYYSTFTKDVDIPLLHRIGILGKATIIETEVRTPKLKVFDVKKRFELFLQVLSNVSSAKQLFQHKLLFLYYVTLLSRPELEIVKLSLACLFSYNLKYLTPYKENLLRILDDKVMRDELLTFNASNDQSQCSIDISHRADVMPLLIRLVYSKLTAVLKQGKLSREQASAKRIAILSFLNNIDPSELYHLIQLMYRGILVQSDLLNCDISIQPTMMFSISENRIVSQSIYSEWYTHVDSIINSTRPESFRAIPWERQIGFLYLLQHIIKVLGYRVQIYVSKLVSMVSYMLQHCQSDFSSIQEIIEDTDDQFDNKVDDNDIEVSHLDTKNISRVRTMCIHRLEEFVHQYYDTFDFSDVFPILFDSLSSLIRILPQAISTAPKAPILLKLISALVNYDTTIHIPADSRIVCESLIRCLSVSRVQPDIVKLVTTSILNLFSINNGQVIAPYAEMIITNISKRFIGSDYDMDTFANLTLSQINISPHGSIRQELWLLCKLAEGIFGDNTNISNYTTALVNPLCISNLSTLLLGMLRTYVVTKKIKVEEELILNILKTYRSLIPHVADITYHVPFLSKLFGPASSPSSFMNFSSVRNYLLVLYEALTSHLSVHEMLVPSFKALSDLLAIDTKILDSRDFDRCIPVFQALSDENNISDLSWNNILGPKNCTELRESSLCYAVLHECVRCLYDSDMIIRNVALSSIKNLIDCICKWSNITEYSESSISLEFPDLWRMEIFPSILIPSFRAGLKSSPDGVKKNFIQLISYVIHRVGSTSFGHSRYQTYHSDLVFLLHDDPDQNFFENISHIQFHRRIRAMNKLGVILSSGDSVNVIQTSSLVHVFLPLGLHLLSSSEFVKKDHLPLMQEAANFLGSIAYQLPWSNYLFLLKSILKRLDRGDVEKEKVYIVAICAILDSFHFDLTKSLNLHVDALEETTINIDEGEDEVEIDAEPSKMESIEGTNDSVIISASPIAETLVNSILPWVRVFLLKEDVDQKGNKTKVVRPAIAVAIAKLVMKLNAHVISDDKKTAIFKNLIISVIGTLRSRDVAVRDLARDSLAKIINTMGLAVLYEVIYELQHMLKEGYQLHVCSYTIRYLLNHVLDNFVPLREAISFHNTDENYAPLAISDIPKTEFDNCIPSIIEIVIDDYTGITQQDRDVEDAHRSLIREAKGIKGHDILEICAKHLLFRPTYALLNLNDPKSISSIHALCTPLLQLLTSSNDKNVIHRVTDGLHRVANGLLNNSTVEPHELLLYLHATLHPFVVTIIKDYENQKRAKGLIHLSSGDADILNIDEADSEEEEDFNLPSYLREDSSDEEEAALYSKTKKSKKNDNVTGYRATTWLPSDKQVLLDQRSVVLARNKQHRELYLVQDGASAPRLTGHDRYANKSKSTNKSALINPALIEAVRFCMTILHNSLKRNIFDENASEIMSMAMSFLPLLGHCVRLPGASSVAALSMRCLCSLLNWTNIDVDVSFSRAVGNRMLKLMFQGGVLVSTDNELVQACIKGLNSLFQIFKKRYDATNGSNVSKPIDRLPLRTEKIRTLLQLLTNSIVDVISNFQSAAFQLIRSIVNARVLLPEVYDLINKLMEQLVFSHFKAVRDSSSSIIVDFILNYPMKDSRFEGHIKQIIANCSYQFEEGRLSALTTLQNIVKILPSAVINDLAQMIFLPLAVRLINDDSSNCRTVTGDIIITLIKRIDNDICSQLLNFTLKWLETSLISSDTANAKALVRTGSQVASLIITAKPDFFKKSVDFKRIIAVIRDALVLMLIQAGELSWVVSQTERTKRQTRDIRDQDEGNGNDGGLEPWAVIYHLLILVENLFSNLSTATETVVQELCEFSLEIKLFCQSQYGYILPNKASLLMELVQESLLFPHVWVRSVACRIIQICLSRRDVKKLTIRDMSVNTQSDFLHLNNGLYQLSRRFCIILNQPSIAPSLLNNAVECLVFIIRAMFYNPQFTREEEKLDDSSSIDDPHDEEDHNDISISDSTSGCNWVMERLRNIGTDTRGLRRLYTVNVFKKLIDIENNEFIRSHIRQILLVAIRIDMTQTGPNELHLRMIKEGAMELLSILEKKLGSSEFIGFYTEVQRDLQSKRLERKHKFAVTAVSDPRVFAEAKVNLLF